MASSLQQVSDGRLLLGIGAGGGQDTPYAAEQRALGRPVPGDRERRRQVEAAVAMLRQVWTGRAGGTGGFLRPDPPPPVIVGGFGPRMAELAGRVGDGVNLQAGHPVLDRLVGVARDARAGSGRDPAGLLVTVFAGLDDRWARPEWPPRQRLDTVGVDRLILLADPLDLEGIHRVGRALV
jgi:alkanesulfonate monooxygenase SsuD/methylene tetrahydromethanopterin reductase-like flavin-dependent oxidoreductase (luciferase family)